MPTSGTFVMTPDSAAILSGSFLNNTAPTVYDINYLQGLLTTGNPASSFPVLLQGFIPGTGVSSGIDVLRLGYSLVGNTISLDGNPPISFSGLPSGFIITSATARIRMANNGSDPTNHFHLTFDPSIQSGDLANNSIQTFNYPGIIPSPLLFFSQGSGIHVNNSISGQRTSRFCNTYSITGAYSIQFFKWNVNGIPADSGQQPSPINVQPGDSITITSGGSSDSLNLNGIVSIKVQETIDGITYEAFATIIEQSKGILVFIVPFSPWMESQDVVTIIAVGDGTQFSGSIKLGELKILIIKASGIYQVISKKTSDTIYDRGRLIDSTEIKIPDPFAKTGRIGG